LAGTAVCMIKENMAMRQVWINIILLELEYVFGSDAGPQGVARKIYNKC
jgi:hypothetical protein